MSMDIRIVGIREADEKHQKNYAAVVALRDAGLPLPDSLSKYYGYIRPERITPDTGLDVVIDRCVEWSDGDMQTGCELFVTDIPPGVKKIRFACAF